jgi:hypothetical protein
MNCDGPNLLCRGFNRDQKLSKKLTARRALLEAIDAAIVFGYGNKSTSFERIVTLLDAYTRAR